MERVRVKAADAPAKKKSASKKSTKSKKARSGDNKTSIVGQMLQRKNGTTAAEVLDKTGWPAVSIPAMAKANGLKLRKEREGRAFRYYGAAAA